MRRRFRALFQGSRLLGRLAPTILKPFNKQYILAEVYKILQPVAKPLYHELLHDLAWRRRWRPTRTGITSLLDQVLHALYAGVVLFPVLMWPSVWTAGISGLILGLLREIEQYFNQDLHILMLVDRLLDTSAFVVGSVVLYLIIS